ncbi:hypothetical protein GCM10023097_71220 [Streptomyces collinus]
MNVPVSRDTLLSRVSGALSASGDIGPAAAFIQASRLRSREGDSRMTAWTWEYEGYDPAHQRLREALCTLGNGRFATRGALPECAADDVHYPGTYAAGCYNRLTSDVADRHVENEDMVNLPNWLPLRFRPAGGRWLTPDSAPVLAHRQTLVLDAGLLDRVTRYGLDDDRVLSVRQRRLVHMGDRTSPPCAPSSRERRSVSVWARFMVASASSAENRSTAMGPNGPRRGPAAPARRPPP